MFTTPVRLILVQKEIIIIIESVVESDICDTTFLSLHHLCLRDPIHAGGGAGPWWPQHGSRWASVQADGTDAEDSLQPNVLHRLHHWRGFPHWGRSVPNSYSTESFVLMSHFVSSCMCFSQSSQCRVSHSTAPLIQDSTVCLSLGLTW